MRQPKTMKVLNLNSDCTYAIESNNENDDYTSSSVSTYFTLCGIV